MPARAHSNVGSKQCKVRTMLPKNQSPPLFPSMCPTAPLKPLVPEASSPTPEEGRPRPPDRPSCQRSPPGKKPPQKPTRSGTEKQTPNPYAAWTDSELFRVSDRSKVSDAFTTRTERLIRLGSPL